jgi:hypothetical protein
MNIVKLDIKIYKVKKINKIVLNCVNSIKLY